MVESLKPSNGNEITNSVGVGIVGLGFMGMTHFLATQRLTGVRAAAISSRDARKRSGDWSSIQGNFGPPGGQTDLTGVNTYATVDALLADPAVDLVSICAPSVDHAPLAIAALRAGKHVLVEKPIALTVADAEAMLAASRAADRLLMVAHVLPFFPEFAHARDLIASGRFGRLRAAHLKRLIARSDRAADSDASGGPAVDLHIHDTHYLGLVCGVPSAVQSRGVIEGDHVTYLTTQYQFEDPNLVVTSASGALSQPGRSFAHGFEFYLDRATILFEFASLGGAGHLATPLTVVHTDGSVERPVLPGSGDPVDAFAAEIAAAAGAVRSGIAAPELSGDLAVAALRLCFAEIESVRAGGRTVTLV